MEPKVLDKLKIAKHKRVLVLNAPHEFVSVLENFDGTPDSQLNGHYSYIQIFITSQSEMIDNGKDLADAIEGDGYLWVCYPKGTSKKYKNVDCNRDTLREAIKQHGFEGVSMISLDDAWSAMRFRNSDYIGK
ncbi:MAG: hypothetical protein FWG14_08180 [Peptococcaceae bacterium]|nr:hypothetical protein [Peptococcaceae bacterium]